MAKTKKAQFCVGDEAYFNNYFEREVEEKKLRPGTKVVVVSVFETEDGEIAYTVENSKGAQENVFSDELRLKEKAKTTKQDVRAALEAEKAQEVDPEVDLFERVDPKEENMKAKLLEGNEGDGRMDIILVGTLAEMLNKDRQDPLAVAKNLLDIGNSSYFRMGGALAYIYLEDLYKDYKDSQGRAYVGTNAFNRFIDDQIPNMKSRRARYYMEIYVKFTNWNVSEAEVVALGWSKCSVIASVANRNTVREWIELASREGMTYEKLKAMAKSQHVSQEGLETEEIILEEAHTGKMEHMKFSVFQDQAAVVKEAFNSVREQHPEIGEEEMSKLFVVMATDYLQNRYAEQGTITPDNYIQYGESVFHGKEVLLRDKQTGEIFSPHYEYGQLSLVFNDTNVEEEEQEIEAVLG